MKANEIKVGQKVTTSGFPGTVTAVCEWSRHGNEVMVEIRLASGVCCVSCRDVRPPLEGYANRWGDAIRGRLAVERARDLSDAELERCLGPCVCGPRLVEVARYMRDVGQLTL